MQLVGIDADDKADGTGKAPTTWISKNIIDNVKLTDFRGGYIQNTFVPLIPSDVLSGISSVTKLNGNYDSTQERVWAPNCYEIGLTNQYDTQSGTKYSSYFKSNGSRIKKLKGATKGWWTRSKINGYYYYVGQDGLVGGSSAAGGLYEGLVIGFCI